MVNLLLKSGAIVNQTTYGGMSPVFMAALNGHEEVVAVLLDNEADIEIRNDDGQKPIDVAKNQKTKDILIAHTTKKQQQEEELQQPGQAAGPKVMDEAQWFQAAKNGDLTMIQQGINNKIDIKCRDSKSRTALWWATLRDHQHLVDYLIKNNADLNIANVSENDISSACNHQLN